jgi:nucleotide-binding universal stress UspA family protein
LFKRLLVPLDRSELAEQVFPAVAELANAFDSEIHVVGVCDPGDKQEQLECGRYMAGKVVDLQGRLPRLKASIKTRVIFGKSADEILSYAEKETIDLVVMSSHGKSGINHWSLGSTVNKVLRHIHIPLLIVRTKDPPDTRSVFARIEVPLDGSERSAGVLPTIDQLARHLHCELILVQVVEPGMHVRTIGGLDYVPFKERNLNVTAAAAREYLESVSANLSETGARVTLQVLAGEAAHEIHTLADVRQCTLIAMCSYRNSTMEAWVMGRVATRVLDSSTQSVWLVPTIAKD